MIKGSTSLTNFDYANFWKNESDSMASNSLYCSLSELLPVNKRVLEIGCGCGNGTIELCKGRKVLSLDINQFSIDLARKRLNGNSNALIHKCDFLKLRKSDKELISDFQPEIIVGWFLGGNGLDVFKHTSEEPMPEKKPKLYREKIEDSIISDDVCISSVEMIHLVNREAMVEGFSDDYTRKSVKEDYNTYVFSKIGFEVTRIDFFEWKHASNSLLYVAAENPLLADGNKKERITSIIAERKK